MNQCLNMWNGRRTLDAGAFLNEVIHRKPTFFLELLMHLSSISYELVNNYEPPDGGLFFFYFLFFYINEVK